MIRFGSKMAFFTGLAVFLLWTTDASAWPRAQRWYYCPSWYAQPVPVVVAPQAPQQATAGAPSGPYGTYYRAPGNGESAVPYTTYYSPAPTYMAPQASYGYYGRAPGSVWASGSQSGVSEPVTDQPTAPLSYLR